MFTDQEYLEALLSSDSVHNNATKAALKRAIEKLNSESGRSVSCEAHRPDICIWRDVETEYYETTCKHSVYFDDGNLEDKPDYKYCPYCGKRIFNEGALTNASARCAFTTV